MGLQGGTLIHHRIDPSIPETLEARPSPNTVEELVLPLLHPERCWKVEGLLEGAPVAFFGGGYEEDPDEIASWRALLEGMRCHRSPGPLRDLIARYPGVYEQATAEYLARCQSELFTEEEALELAVWLRETLAGAVSDLRLEGVDGIGECEWPLALADTGSDSTISPLSRATGYDLSFHTSAVVQKAELQAAI